MKKRKLAKKHRSGTRRSKTKARKSSAKKRSAGKAKSRKVKKARPKRPAKARKKPRPSKARSARKRAPSKKAKKARRPAVKKAKAKKKALKPKKKAPKARVKKAPKRAKPVKAAAKPKARVAKPKRAKTRALLSSEERKKKRAKDLAKLIAMRKKKKQTAAPARKPKGAAAQEPGHEPQAAERTATKRTPPRRISHIRKRELEKLRSELLEERERLIQELKALDEITHTDGEAGGNHQIPGSSIHLAEYATDNQTIETALDLRRIQHERLTQVEEALQRVERGDYGICESCGKAININRLLAKPFARFCIPCRRDYEAQRS